jgi:hypothetical protein
VAGDKAILEFELVTQASFVTKVDGWQLSKHDMGSGLASKLASDLILALNLEN